MEYNLIKTTQKRIDSLIKKDLFNNFFQQLKTYTKKRKKKKNKITLSDEIMSIDKRDIIIFSIGEKIKNIKIEEEYLKKRFLFPFDKFFLEGVLIYTEDDHIAICDGIFFQRKENIIICSTKWVFFSPILPENYCRISHFGFREDEIMQLNNGIKEEDSLSEDGVKFGQKVFPEIKRLVQQFMVAIDKKEYTTYKKWTHKGFETKEIVYAYDVRTHKRHFWEDSGRFNIPNMCKEDILAKGYFIDELVYRDGELRKSVPYKIIGSYVVNENKEKDKENRRIELLKERVWKSEAKLGFLLREIFPSKFIKKHDRKKLKGLELDYYIPELRLAFEYDGEQHYDKRLCEDIFKSDFEKLKKRDRKKDVLCRKKGIRLIRIKYDEPLNKRYIKKRVKEE